MLRKILLIGWLVLSCVSCDEDVSSPVPLAKVNLKINLTNSVTYDNLKKGPLYYVIANAKTIKPLNATDAFGCNGLLLIVNIANKTSYPYDIRAYDLYCPNDGSSVEPDNANFTETATCPKCKIQYNVGDGGYPKSGSKYWLKVYNVYYKEITDEYIVTN